MNFVFFGVKKSGICLFLVSVENGAGVNNGTGSGRVVTKLRVAGWDGTGSEKILKAKNHISVPEWDKHLCSCDVASRARAF